MSVCVCVCVSVCSCVRPILVFFFLFLQHLPGWGCFILVGYKRLGDIGGLGCWLVPFCLALAVRRAFVSYQHLAFEWQWPHLNMFVLF